MFVLKEYPCVHHSMFGTILPETRIDENMTAPDTTIRANQQVSSFLCTSFYDFENGMLPNIFIMLRDNGEDQGGFENKLGGGRRQPTRLSQARGPQHPKFESALVSRSSVH
jgi:hypothetical protein